MKDYFIRALGVSAAFLTFFMVETNWDFVNSTLRVLAPQ